jgi:hypothetical protein
VEGIHGHRPEGSDVIAQSKKVTQQNLALHEIRRRMPGPIAPSRSGLNEFQTALEVLARGLLIGSGAVLDSARSNCQKDQEVKADEG